LTFSELVAHETALVTGPAGEDGEDGFVLALLEAPEADGPTVTVLVTVGVADGLADDEQPATAARQLSAAAETAPENTALGNTACPSCTRRLVHRPAIMTTGRATWLAPHRRWVYGGLRSR
jgi:hypothetical protein